MARPSAGADRMSGSSATIPFLDRDRVASLLPGIAEQIALVERTYRALAGGRVEMPPKIGIHPRPNAFIHAMPAYLRDDDVAAIKWVSGYPENPSRGLPYINGVIVVNDAATGMPLAVLDGAEITAARTAAASAACVAALAPAGWNCAAVLGAGEQGRYHAWVLRTLRPDCEIRAYDVVRERAASLCERVLVVDDPREAVEGAAVVVTAGPIVEHPRPVIDGSWLRGEVLLLPIDFDFYVTADAVGACDLFLTDDVEQFEYYRRLGHFAAWSAPRGSVGEAFASGWDGRRVVCANLGVGALDAVFARAVLDRAPELQLSAT